MKVGRPGIARFELVCVLAVIVALPGLVLPVLSTTRQASWQDVSRGNLRMLGAAHFVYAVDWNGRQLTFVDDRISTYGHGPHDAFYEYWQEHGGGGDSTMHPPVALGWGQVVEGGEYRWLAYRTGNNVANAMLTLPIVFDNPSYMSFFGAFRLPNAAEFHQYLNGRFYDRVFYPPTDTAVISAISEGFESQDEYWNFADVGSRLGDIPAWSSYCLSPAAMFDPAVMAHDDPESEEFEGWTDPWELPDGFRSPSLFHARYPTLKTHMLEHHWLFNRPEDFCNPGFDPGTYGYEGGYCEPYYFNHGLASRPVTLFYDGHVAVLPVADAMAADELVRQQQHEDWGLWSKDTPWDEDGYLIEYGHDRAETSFHVLTTDGILGRDITAMDLDGPPDGGSRRSDLGGRRRATERPRPAAVAPVRLSLTGE